MKYLVSVGLVVALCAGVAAAQVRFGEVYAPRPWDPDRMVDLRLFAMTPNSEIVYAKRVSLTRQEVWVGRMDDRGSAVWGGNETVVSLTGNGAGLAAFSTTEVRGHDMYESRAYAAELGGSSWVVGTSERQNDMQVGPMGTGTRVVLSQSPAYFHAFDAYEPSVRNSAYTYDFDNAYSLYPRNPRVLVDGSVHSWGGGGFETRMWNWNPDTGDSRIVIGQVPATREFQTVWSVSVASNGLAAVIARSPADPSRRAIFLVDEGEVRQLDLTFGDTPFAFLQDASINSAGQILFTAYNGQRHGLYLYDGGVTTRLLEEYGPFLGSTVGGMAIGPASLNDRGEFAFSAWTGDRRQGVFAGVIPAPGTVMLLGMAAVGVARRRR